VVLLLAEVRGQHETVWPVVVELLIGIAIGVAVPWLGIRLEEGRFFKVVGIFEPLNAFALGLFVLAICYCTGALPRAGRFFTRSMTNLAASSCWSRISGRHTFILRNARAQSVGKVLVSDKPSSTLSKKFQSCIGDNCLDSSAAVFGPAYPLDWRGKRQESHRFEGHLTLTLPTGADPYTGHCPIISGQRLPLRSRWRCSPVPSPPVSSATGVRSFLPEPKSGTESSWCHTGGISA
jgi:hypothetical protein